MGPVQSIKTCLRKSFILSGRASRSEFWWFTAASTLACCSLMIAVSPGVMKAPFVLLPMSVVALSPLAGLTFLFAAGIRRMHDADLSGVFFILPTIGSALLLAGMLLSEEGPISAAALLMIPILALCTSAMCALPTHPVANKFGPTLNEALS